MTRPLAVVTGASSGIGEAFAKVLAGDGYDLLLIARRSERLERLGQLLAQRHGVATQPMTLDLSDPGAPAKVAARLEELNRVPAVLVNNAGGGLDGAFLDQPWDNQAAMLQLMLHTPTELIHRLLPGMLEAHHGRIITIGSLGGFLHSTPHETLYGPVKHYGIALSRSLAGEYRGTGVTFTAVCPGFTATEMMDHGRPAVAKEKVPGWVILSADRVAAVGWRAATKGQPVVIPGFVNKAIVLGVKVLPTNFGDRLVTRGFDRVTGISPAAHSRES